MRWLVLALPLVVALLAPTRAEASGCYLGPFTTTYDPHLGCEVVFYEELYAATTLQVKAQRGSAVVDINATITTSMADVPARYTNYACDGSIIEDSTRTQMYLVSRLMLEGVQIGDGLTINGNAIGTVTAAGACVEDASRVMPFCTGVNSGYPCDGDGSADAGVPTDEVPPGEDGGCNATGGSAGLLCALLALVKRRRRRRE